MNNKLLPLLITGGGLYFLYKAFAKDYEFNMTLDDIFNVFSDSSCNDISDSIDNIAKSVSIDGSSKSAVDSICRTAVNSVYDSDKEYYVRKLAELVKGNPSLKSYAISKIEDVTKSMMFESSRRKAIDCILKA